MAGHLVGAHGDQRAAARRVLVASLGPLLLVAAAADAVAADRGAGSGLAETLVQELGVTRAQATGGAGAIFALAEATMDGDDFSKLLEAVPEVRNLITAAPKLGASTRSERGAAALDAFVGQGGALAGATQLADAFAALDLEARWVASFESLCVAHVRRHAGPDLAAALRRALP